MFHFILKYVVILWFIEKWYFFIGRPAGYINLCIRLDP